MIQIRQSRAFYWRVVIGVAERDNTLLSGVCVNHEPVIARRNYFIFFREKEDCRCLNCLRIRNAVELSRNLQGDRTRKQPEIPPAKPAQDHLAQRQRIMQNQSGDRPLPGDMERSRAAQACSVEQSWPSMCVVFEFIKRGDRCW